MPSTNFNPSYMISSFAPLVETEDGNARIDFLSEKLQVVSNPNLDYQILVWPDDLLITTLAFKAFGHTTAFWIILMFNGYQDALEIPPGAMLKIPTEGEIRKLLPDQRTISVNRLLTV